MLKTPIQKDLDLTCFQSNQSLHSSISPYDNRQQVTELMFNKWIICAKMVKNRQIYTFQTLKNYL